MPPDDRVYQTRTTMFERLRNPQDTDAWRAFQATYFDLVVRYARHAGLSHADAEDVAQGVLLGFVKVIPKFQYDRTKGKFRSYLGRCTSHAVARWKMCPGSVSIELDDIEASARDGAGRNGDETDAAWEREWVAFHYRRALEAVRQRCEPKSVEVLEAYARGLPTSQIAESCAMSEDAVRKTLQRMRTRLAEQIAAQVKEEDDGRA